jgi:hypothetical protein
MFINEILTNFLQNDASNLVSHCSFTNLISANLHTPFDSTKSPFRVNFIHFDVPRSMFLIVPEINAHGVFKVKVNPSEETSEMYSGKSFAISRLSITPVAPRGRNTYNVDLRQQIRKSVSPRTLK